MTQGTLEVQIAGKDCGECESVPRIIWGGSFGINDFILRCNCPFVDGRPAEPKLRKQEHYVARRRRRMETQDLARREERGEKVIKYDTDRGEVALSVRVVQELFCKDATPFEALAFMQLCRYQQLNPFLREIYIVKYGGGSSAQFIIGKAAYTARAERHPNFDGMEEGIVVRTEVGDGGGVVDTDIAGSIVPKGDELVGSWCKVYRKDRRMPTYKRLSLEDYDKNQSVWKTMKATMIVKCAIVAALRDAFPSMFSTLNEIADRIDEPIDARLVDRETGEIADEVVEGQIVDQTPVDAEPTPEESGGTPAEDEPFVSDLFPPDEESATAEKSSVVQPEEPPTLESLFPFADHKDFIMAAMNHLGWTPFQIRKLLGLGEKALIDYADQAVWVQLVAAHRASGITRDAPR